MGQNASGDDFTANDKEVFQSYRIPARSYKKKNSAPSSASATTPASPITADFSQRAQQRLRSGSLSSGLDRHGRRERPVSHPPSILSNTSSNSSLNLSIVHAAVAAGSSPSTSVFGYPGHFQPHSGYPLQHHPYTGLVSAPLPFGAGVGSGGSSTRTNSGYSIGSELFDHQQHSVGSGLGRATYVNGKIVEVGAHGSPIPGSSPSTPPFYGMHSNYTVQDFMSYQQQQQQQFLEQQQFEYQQMLLLQQQQHQLKQQYQHQQLLLLQQQQLEQQQQQQLQRSSLDLPVSTPPTSPLHSQQITGVVLQTKSRRPARHPDRAFSANTNGTSNGQSSHGSPKIRHQTSPSITIPSSPSAPSSSNGHQHQRQGASRYPQSSSLASSGPRSATVSATQSFHYSSSPGGSASASSSYTGAASSFSSSGSSHYHPMLTMTSTTPPSSSSSSSLSMATAPMPSSSTNTVPAADSTPTSPNKGMASSKVYGKAGLSIEEIAAKILPPRRLLGGREYYPDMTLPYLLPCDEQESERLLLQHYVIRYAFGSNIIAPIDTSIAGKVLDCACGPGTWVMEMATEFEDLDFYGFDVSPMYPSAIHPKNAHFSMGNLLDPEIPFHSDSFLLVHQRNMLLGLTQDAWPGVVQDLFRCVIPGGQGWLQLCEVDPIWSRPGPVSRSVLKMLNETAQNRNVDVLLPQQLDRVLKEAGCENVKMIMVEIPIGPWGGKIGLLWRDVLKAEMEALKPVVLQAALENAVAAGADIAVCGAEMTTAEEWEEMMNSVWEEMDQYRTYSQVFLAYGQKP